MKLMSDFKKNSVNTQISLYTKKKFDSLDIGCDFHYRPIFKYDNNSANKRYVKINRNIIRWVVLKI
jgi:hypothetical protein